MYAAARELITTTAAIKPVFVFMERNNVAFEQQITDFCDKRSLQYSFCIDINSCLDVRRRGSSIGKGVFFVANKYTRGFDAKLRRPGVSVAIFNDPVGVFGSQCI